ncbi:hypothetical protein [Ktedonospora formicarum]|uniref:Uncharacterized protein n=1 Tax=Ktedonospora formicarum TaxID=2778364 RepID=A0A8J3IGW3_9CHLR|nr:hypothetical protein [Ktedonospora formicarum]GHO50934.1 hypothetical protein KSX_90970 [Ktedonospora formicarum]
MTFANALISQWPAERTLEFLHVPLAAGETPPPLRETFYRDLRRLKLPAGTRFAAGLVHEKSSLEEQQQVLKWVEQAIGHPVDVAAACGLGRRDRQVAETLLERSKELAEG